MKLLILGGTKFLGRHLVDAALAQGHDITLFNRGQTNNQLYPQVEKLRGDRDRDLGALEQGSWDAVVDTCGYVPRIMEQSVRALKDKVDTYAFISSISVYAEPHPKGLTEDAPVAKLEDETSEEILPNYGGLKALCENEVRKGFPENHVNVRAGLLVGPYDPTGRFTWWVNRLHRGGDVLAPGKPERNVQFIDARDLAAWVIHALEQGHRGTFNVTGPLKPLPFGELLSRGLEAHGAEGNLHWVDDGVLLEKEVAPWTGLPLWLPEEANGLMEVDIGKVSAAGLQVRPLAETFRDTLAWAGEDPDTAQGPAGEDGTPVMGLTADKENELLGELGT